MHNNNPRAERNELVRFVATLPMSAITALHLNLDDQTYQATLDYLDPDLVHIFIGNQAVRKALVAGCITHILATYASASPHPATP